MDFKFDLQMFADVIEVETEYQLKWGGEGGTGIFAVTVTTDEEGKYIVSPVDVAAQSAPTVLQAPELQEGATEASAYYLVAANTVEDDVNKIEWSLQKVTTTKEDEAEPTPIVETIDDADIISGTVNLTAGDGAPLNIQVEEAPINFTITNLAANSKIALKAGDTAKTGTLSADDKIFIGDSDTVGLTAAADGTLEFVGESVTVEDETTNATALLSGSIKMSTEDPENPATVELAGDSRDLSDNITVKTTDADGLTVKAVDGKVSAITGLSGKDATVTTEETSVTTVTVANVEVSVTTNTEYTYKALDDAGTMIERTKSVQAGENEPVTTTDYLDVKAGDDIYSATYSSAVYKGEIGEWNKNTNNAVYYYLKDGVATAANDTSLVTTANADPDEDETARTTRDVAASGADKGKFQAIAGGYYLKVSSTYKTGTPATTTIGNFELYQGNAAGELKKVTTESYTGTLTVEGAGNIVNYTKPANAAFHVNIEDADIRSKFTNLQIGTNVADDDETAEDETVIYDHVTTKATTYTDLSGTYNIYGGDSITASIKITGKASVVVGDGGTLSNITAFDGSDKVTVETAAEKKVFTGTGVKSVTEDGVTTKYDTFDYEVTDKATGKTTKYERVLVPQGSLKALYILNDTVIADVLDTATKATPTIVTDFDWTMDKCNVGYFLASGNSVNVKTLSTTIKDSDTPVKYIKAELVTDDDGNATGEVELSVVEITNLEESPSVYSGTVNITAPSTAIKLNFNREESGLEKAGLKITNLAADSNIGFALTSKDEIKTAKLAEKDMITVGTSEFVAASGTTLTIKQGGLYSGTVWAGTADDAGTVVTVGKYTIANGKEITAGSDITDVSFTVTANNGTSFTLGALDDGDVVTVTDANTNSPLAGTYIKNGTYLYNFADDDYNASTAKMYSLGTAKTIQSANLNTKNGTWKKAYDTSANPHITSTVKLALADKAITADETDFSFVRDKYSTTDYTKATNIAATIKKTVSAYDVAQGAVGDLSVTGDDAKGLTHKYVAAGTAQTIEATNGWEVVAGAADTTIKGAASGKDYLTANNGNDTITLSGAADIVDETNLGGKDTISGYFAGKDKLKFAAGTKFTLSTSIANDVYAADDEWAEDTASYALLKGVGGKAVTIKVGDSEYADYYFANGKSKTNSFNYVDGAYYVGNSAEGATNTLKVATDKNKKTKTNTTGTAIAVSLGDPKYDSINVLDASSSANEVVLTAKDGVDSTLKGGMYVSTLISGTGNDTLYGGSGENTFVLGNIAANGKDTIKKYNSSKDKLTTTATLTADSFAIADDNKNNVVLGGNVTIEGAVGKAITLTDSVGDKTAYIGKSGVANTFTVSAKPSSTDIYVGSTATDTIKISRVISDLTLGNPTAEDDDTVSYTISKYQGGKVDLSGTNVKSIEVVDASGLKASSTTVSEYGTKFVKSFAGVDVTAANAGVGNEGTTFTGSSFNDRFTCGDGKDTIKYTAGHGDDVIKNFGVDDVIQLNGLSTAEIKALSAENANVGAVLGGFSSGRSLNITTAADTTLEFSKTGNKYTVKGVSNAG